MAKFRRPIKPGSSQLFLYISSFIGFSNKQEQKIKQNETRNAFNSLLTPIPVFSFKLKNSQNILVILKPAASQGNNSKVLHYKLYSFLFLKFYMKSVVNTNAS